MVLEIVLHAMHAIFQSTRRFAGKSRGSQHDLQRINGFIGPNEIEMSEFHVSNLSNSHVMITLSHYCTIVNP